MVFCLKKKNHNKTNSAGECSDVIAKYMALDEDLLPGHVVKGVLLQSLLVIVAMSGMLRKGRVCAIIVFLCSWSLWPLSTRDTQNSEKILLGPHI